MSSRLATALFVLACSCAFSFAQSTLPPDVGGSGNLGSHYVPVLKFDPKRDAAADIRAAVAEAQKTGKRILVDVGGDWCSWCHVLDEFFAQHPDISRLRDNNFIMVPVFYSHEDKNQKVLSSYPELEGIPHFFVLEKDGALLCSQGMVKLETGGEPDPEKIKRFLMKWSTDQNKMTGASR